MELNLTGQNIEYADVAPKLLKLKQLMDQRKAIWDRLDLNQRKKLVQLLAPNPGKDVIFEVALDMVRYFRNFGLLEYADDL